MKRIILTLSITLSMILATSIPFLNPSSISFAASGTAQQFINDARWRNGVSWGASKGPEISAWPSSGCAAYAADFAKYVYDKDNPRSGTRFGNASEISSGDIIEIPGHWFVVISRNGDSLYTAEGNFSGVVRVATNVYTVSGNTLYDKYNGAKTVVNGYHYTSVPINRQPVGNLDLAIGGTGTVRVAGWAYDPDSPSTSLAIHIYIGGPAGSGGVMTQAITANGERPDVNNSFGIPGNHGFDFSFKTTATGSQPIYAYAIDTSGGNNPEIGNATVNIAADNTKPVISNISVTNITSSGYTISCKVTDTGSGVNKVQFPTWTSKNGQDDLANNWDTVTGTKNGDIYTFIVKVSDHNNESGVYYTHIYAYDNAGNCTSGDGRTVTVPGSCIHKNTEIRDKIDATCTESGYSGDVYCKDCFALVEKGKITSATGHKWDGGKVTKEATATEEGSMTYTCTVCNETKVEIIKKRAESAPTPGPASDYSRAQTGKDGTAVGHGASALVAEKAIMNMATDSDPKGTVFSELTVRSSKQTNTSISLKWTRVSNASKYVIYGNKCGKNNKMKKLATSTGKSKTIKKVAGKKLGKGKYYKFIIVALDKNNNVVSTSKIIHVATKGGKVGNHKKVTVKKSVIAKAKKLKKGKSLRLNAKAVKASKLKVEKHRALCYESSNPKIATVSKKGVVKGKKKGTCYIYVYAQNGVFKKVKVVVY